ncbi:MAG TPA: hypothetical protein VIJ68_00435 [Candidatus Saccharimonadales bacterium]
MDHLTRSITPKEAADMVAGCNLVADVIEKEAPDIVFFPLRGAGPIEWVAAEALRQRSTVEPVFVDLPIGTSINARTRRLSGLTGRQKLNLVDQRVEELVAAGVYVPGKSKLMIVDEVQKGRTLTQASEAIRRSMIDRGDDGILRVVAVQDSRGEQIGAQTQRTHGYRKLVTNEREGFKSYILPTALFTVDRERYLDAIVSGVSEAETGEMHSDDFYIAKNVEAREIFQALVRSYYSPEAAQDEVDMIKREDLKEDIGLTALQFAVADALTDPREVRKPTDSERIIEWWEQFIRISSRKEDVITSEA